MVILASVGMLLATRLPREHTGPLAKRLSSRLGRAGARGPTSGARPGPGPATEA
jgi:hypothetical protein